MPSFEKESTVFILQANIPSDGETCTQLTEILNTYSTQHYYMLVSR
jgi:hypothetical protein